MIADKFKSEVIFDEDSHTYTRDGKELSGITGLIHSVLKLGVYPGASPKAWQVYIPQAGYHGSCVHQAIYNLDTLGIETAEFGEKEHETQDYGTVIFPAQDVSAELGFYKEALPNGWSVYASEFIVDYGDFASAIDSIWGDDSDEEGDWLVDFKTNNLKAYPGGEDGLKTYLSWQLSCYAVMYERQTHRKVKGLIGLWLGSDEYKKWDIVRQPDEQVIKLLNTVILPNPDYDPNNHESSRFIYINEEMQVEEAQIISTTSDLTVPPEITKAIADLLRAEKVAKAMKDRLRELMEQNGIVKWANDEFTATIGKPSKNISFDTARFKEEHPDIYAQYTKETEKKGSFTLKLK